jgi:1,4-alpha-glucan branching enzyme
MLQKKPLAGRKVEVTFRMPPMDDVVELFLSGDFNDWKVKDVPLTLESDGTWVGTLVLDAGKTYRYRFHDNQGNWHTDYEADSFVTNAYGTDDSVVDLTQAAKKSSPETKSVKKAAKKPATKGAKKAAKKTAAGRKPKAKR